MKKKLFSSFLSAVDTHANSLVELKLAEVSFFCDSYQELD